MTTRRPDVRVAPAPCPPPGKGAAAGPTLRRTLGLWQVSLSGIGVILGAGVYALVGPAAGLAGNARGWRFSWRAWPPA
jgi:amino acid transporter